jgi:molybdate transport system substrate-binding protein
MHPRPLVPALLALALLAGGCGGAPEDREVVIFAASSLSDVAPELAAAHAARGGAPVRFSFGSTATMGRIIAAGAPADALLGVGQQTMFSVGERAEVCAFTSLAWNELVVVVPASSDAVDQDWELAERIAVGDWRAEVPVGVAAKWWLEHEGRWAALESRLVPTVDARAALAAVSSGSVEAGIVYATDAASTDRVRVVGRPENLEMDLDLGIWIVWLDEPGQEVRSFSNFMRSGEAQAIWRKHGFRVGSS